MQLDLTDTIPARINRLALRAATDIARDLLRRAQADPVWWVERVFGAPLWSKEREILESVRDHPRTAVRSCHASGKSYSAARAALHWLYAYPHSIVLTTAPTWRQVQKIIWQEIRAAWTEAQRRGYALGGELLQTELKITDGWFAFGFATDRPDAFQGIHAEDILVILDEAAGVTPDIWTAADAVLTTRHARLLAIGNPTEPAGPFAAEFHTPGTNCIHISAFDTPNLQAGRVVIPGLVTSEWVEDKARRWGEGSPLYATRVLGNFPDASDDSLIPLGAILAAQERTLDPPEGSPRVLGVDVARFGGDLSVLALREGPRVRLLSVQHGADTMETTGRILAALAATGATEACVDVVGVGGGVVDRLSEQRAPVTPINVGESAFDGERFENRRAELYWGLRERFLSGDIDLDPDEELAAELAALRYRITSRGRIAIESKDDAKKRGIGSPDRADAVVLAFAGGAPRFDVHASFLVS